MKTAARSIQALNGLTMALALAAALVSSPDLVGQGVSEGLMLGAPMTVIIGPGTISSSGTLDESRLHRKRVGYVPFSPDAPPVQPMTPDFRAAVLFGDGVNPPTFEVNAISMGMEILPVSKPAGGVSMVTLSSGSNDWGMLTFSVSRSSLGTPGSMIAMERSQPGGAAADLFTYVLPGSSFDPSIIDCYEPDTVQRSVDALEMDLSFGGTVGEISAMDFFPGLYEAGSPLSAPLPSQPTVYFSIASSSIFPTSSSAVDPAWFGGEANMSSASILQTTWDDKAFIWCPPTVFHPYGDMGLDKTDDIDALAIDVLLCKAVFSVTSDSATTLAEQLQVAEWCGGITVGDLYATDGTNGGTTSSVASRVELEDDDEVDGLCVQDPGAQFKTLSTAYGVPIGDYQSQNTKLAASMFRDDAGAVPRITLMVEKLPTIGPSQLLGLMILGQSGSMDIGPIMLANVGAGNPDSARRYVFRGPSLGVVSMDTLQIVFIMAGSGLPVVTSPVLEIGFGG